MIQAAGMTRRDFLIATSAATLLAVLDSCTFGQASKAGATIPIPPGSSPYEQALELLHQAVLASPDHLAQRANQLVAGKDPTKMVEFVRDQIAVVPVIEGYGDPSHSRRWGSAATLRAGRGTLRERADVLADMLNRAGFKALVQVGDRPSALTAESLYRARPLPTFAPDRARVDLARSLLRQAGLPAAPTQQPFDPGPDQAAAILKALPAAAQVAHTRNDLLPPTVPVVVYQVNGKQQYGVALGDMGVVDTPLAHLSPQGEDDVPNVRITVSAIPSPALGAVTPQTQSVDLVSGTWPADEVFGHQVLLTFVPPQGAKAVLDSGLAALPLRVPVLQVQNTSVTPDQAAKLAVAGQMITVHGDVLGSSSATADPTATDTPGPYGSFKLLSDSDRAAAVSSVKSITTKASAATFSDVYLECSLKDAAGSSVDGLDAASFTVKEEGAPVGSFVLYS
ncbi:MAG: hypothetical protein WB682_00965, partial [Candidatus Dormiibacterota bacterium]